MFFLGIDPGVSGAAVVIESELPKIQRISWAPSASHPERVEDFERALRNYSRMLADGSVAIELPAGGYLARKGDARSKGGLSKQTEAGANFGMAVGMCIGILGIWPIMIDARSWKRQVGVTSDKETSRQAATDIFHGHQFWRSRADIAEASLLAYWAMRNAQRAGALGAV